MKSSFFGPGAFGFNAGFAGSVTAFSPIDLTGLGLYSWHDAELSPMTLESTSITQLNDLGPNGYHLGNTGSNRPTLSSDGGSNFSNKPVISFSGSNQYLFAAVDDIADHAAVIMAVETTANDNSSAHFHLGNSAIVTGLESYLASATTQTISSKPASTQQTISRTGLSFPDVQILEVVADQTNSRLTLIVNGEEHSHRSMSVWGNTINLLEMGRIPNSAYGLNGKVHSMVILAGSGSTAISGDKRRDVRNYINDRLGIFTYKDSLIFIGDSLTNAAQAASDGQTGWVEQLQSDIGTTNYRFHNEAVIGWSTSNITNLIQYGYAAQWIEGRGTTSRAFVLAGTNDLVSGATAAATFAGIQAIVDQLISDGIDEIYVGTIIAGGGASSTWDSRRLSTNTLLRAWDLPVNVTLVDLAADEIFDTAADSDNSTYYYTDTVHLKTAGYAVLMALLKAAASLS